jgi:hypothetical protein
MEEGFAAERIDTIAMQLQLHGRTLQSGKAKELVGFLMRMCALYSMRITLGMEQSPARRDAKAQESNTLDTFIRLYVGEDEVKSTHERLGEMCRIFRPMYLPGVVVPLRPWEDL